MPMLDLGPATQQLGELVARLPDDSMAGPTPCPEYSLADLVEHIGGLAIAFTDAATKDLGEASRHAPSVDGSRLPADWRSRVPQDLSRLAEAWRDPAAWTGMTRAGGVDMPGDIAGLVALDELVLHGWDVAAASGQPYRGDPELVEAVHGFVSQFSGPGQEEARAGLFGPVVDVRDDAPLLDRVLGLAGRDPAWSPPT